MRNERDQTRHVENTRNTIRVLALVPYPLGEAPGQRYRIEQWAPYLAREGVEISFVPFSSDRLSELLYQSGRTTEKAYEMLVCAISRVKAVLAARTFDAVFLYREASLIGPALLERLLKARNHRIVFDFDDAIWLRYVSPRNRYLSYLKAPGKTATICRLASHVTAGSNHLADYARMYNRSVSVVPSTVSLASYEARPASKTNLVPVIGWTGSHSSAQYLDLVKRPLQMLAKRRAFRLLVIGLDAFDIPGVAVETRPWRSASEARDLWDIDVGIMPLPDDRWTRGKCAMKALQYLGVGAPAVASPVGANREVISEGENGFLADTEESWVASLERLLDDQALRARLGAAGRRLVEERYSAEAVSPTLASILRGVAS